MFGYYFALAFRSLRRTPALTALMIVAIGVGIGIAMTALAIFRTAAGDPIPSKATQLFTPQIDDCGPSCGFSPPYVPSDRLPLLLSYRDADSLMRAARHQTQAAMYASVLTAMPPDAMFQVPFRYGNPWSRQEDDAHAAVAVITRTLDDRMFGGMNSVGKTLRLNGRDYRITGVMDNWQPVPRFYDLVPEPSGEADAVFIPFTAAIDRHFMPRAVVSCSGPGPTRIRGPEDVWNDLVTSDCSWVQFWVDLPTPVAARRYRQLLTAYAAEQQRIGRFQWPPRVQLRDVTQWLHYLDVVPAEVRVAVIVAFSLLAACLVNAMGVILARFLPRARDVSVRRATGATRPAIFVQSLVEVGTIGVFGAALGLLLTALDLRVSRVLLPPELLDLARFDGADAVIAVVLSIVMTLLAGLYPMWRMTRVQPAFQLKGQ